MDGVIVDSIPVHFGIWKRLGERFGFPMTKELFDHKNGMDTSDIARQIVDQFKLGIDPMMIVAEKRRLATAKLMEGVDLFPGVLMVLNTLKRLGYMIALGTMSVREHTEYALMGKLDGFEFDALVTAEDVARPKPDPEIFLKCADILDLSPKQCVVVEDSINGIHAAKKGGMFAVAVTSTTSAEKLTEADRIISRISEFDSSLISGLDSD